MLGVAAALAVFAGCGGKDGGKTEPLRFWHFWDAASVDPLLRAFEAEHPGIKVEAEQLTWKSGLEKIQAAIASGTQPDLCELGSKWVLRFAYEGVLDDLTPVYTELADSFMMWESARWKGRVYGLPWLQGSRALFFNIDLFEKAGLDPDPAPRDLGRAPRGGETDRRAPRRRERLRAQLGREVRSLQEVHGVRVG